MLIKIKSKKNIQFLIKIFLNKLIISKITMKIQNFFVLFIFFLTNIVQSQDKTCYKDLLTSYNLFGLNSPEEITLEMCPEIKESCCSKEDQLTIYNNWRHHKEGQRIKKHYH